MKFLSTLTVACLLAAPAFAQDTQINYGDDSGSYANDGECDDRRFTGPGMASVGVDWSNFGRDATDCQNAVEAGTIKLWNQQDATNATQCSAIDFGSDTHEASNDGECDDPRFEGVGSSYVLDATMNGTDATDCQRACEMGIVALRDY